MQALYRAVIRELREGRPAMLVTVLAATGSTPRGPGAMMAVFSDGGFAGTVGGGSAEYHAQRRAAELLARGGDAVEDFHFTPGDAASLGMVCGGDQTLLFQHLAPERLPVFQALSEAESQGRDLWLLCRIREGRVTELGVADRAGVRFCAGAPEDAAALLSNVPISNGEGWWAFPAVRAGHAYIFGGGHVSQALTAVLAPLGFRPVVYDDRPEFAAPDRFPLAERAICGDYAELNSRLALTPDDYIIVMTRGHQADDLVLSRTLRCGARYIGCIGSRRKLAISREHLLSQGFSEAEWAAVHAPIGLAIGAETPEEIAVAVAAELIAVRAGAPLPR